MRSGLQSRRARRSPNHARAAPQSRTAPAPLEPQRINIREDRRGDPQHPPQRRVRLAKGGKERDACFGAVDQHEPILVATRAANASARTSVSAMPGQAPRRTSPRRPQTPAPLQQPPDDQSRGKSGAAGSRGGRRITSASSASASKTIEQTGSITISRNAMCIGPEDQRPAEQQRQQRQPGDRHVHRDDVAMALRRLS